MEKKPIRITKETKIPSYPPAPSPEELEDHSKKFMILGVILFLVLMVGAVVYLFLPAPEIPIIEEIAPPVEIGLHIFDFKFCSALDANYNCVNEKQVFTLGETFAMTYKFENFDTTPVREQYLVRIKKEIKFFDAQGNIIPYAAEDFSPSFTLAPVLDDIPDNLYTGEEFSLDFPEGEYYLEVSLSDMLSGEETSGRFKFLIQ